LNDLASLLNDDDKKYEWPMKCTAGTFTGGYCARAMGADLH
jgi:hypothetical protein